MGSIKWGTFFVAIGLILLVFSIGLVSWKIFVEALKFWPLIFVIIGVALFFHKGDGKIEEAKE